MSNPLLDEYIRYLEARVQRQHAVIGAVDVIQNVRAA